MLSLLNRHAHGFIAIPTIQALDAHGFFARLETAPATLEEICRQLEANLGHLAGAVRLLESMGWITRRGDHLVLTSDAQQRTVLPSGILELLEFKFLTYLSGDGTTSLAEFVEQSLNRWGFAEDKLADFIDGLLIPKLFIAMRTLGTRGGSQSIESQFSESFGQLNTTARTELTRLMVGRDWGSIDGHSFAPNAKGLFLFERSHNLAMVISYSPMLRKASDLFFGDSAAIFELDEAGHELHIDRTLNVEGSGFQHQRYFADLDDVIIRIFDNGDFSQQPNYIADMGCGDGSLLRSIYLTIRDRTKRGQVLSRYPVTLIGIDLNPKALVATEKTLKGLPNCLFEGDINKPDHVLGRLEALDIGRDEVLHIRTFIDHDRRYQSPVDQARAAQRNTPQDGGGIYAERNGQLAPWAVAYQALVEHFSRWTKIIGRHGLLLFEVHSLPSSIVSQYIDECENLHFDAFHAYSGQQLFYAKDFLMAVGEAGLLPNFATTRRYPRTLPYTRIVLHWLAPRAFTIRTALDKDIGALIDLEMRLWPTRDKGELQTEILDRVRLFPDYYYVAECDDRVLGAMYTLPLSSHARFDNLTCRDLDNIRDQSGDTLMFVSLSIDPDAASLGLASELRDFVLLKTILDPQFQRITGVTRTSAFVPDGRRSYSEYVKLLNEHGFPVDPTLGFHVRAGAMITGIQEGFRPFDFANEGRGVWIVYEIRTKATESFFNQEIVPRENEDDILRSTASPDYYATILTKFVRSVRAKSNSESLTTDILDVPFRDYGLDSLDLTELRHFLKSTFAAVVPASFLFDYPTIRAVAEWLFECSITVTKMSAPQSISSSRSVPVDSSQSVSNQSNVSLTDSNGVSADAVAIIGIGLRLPGSISQLDDFKDLITAKRTVFRAIPDCAIRSDLRVSEYAEIGGYIDDIEKLDHCFFGLSIREKELMDPQQRMLLEVSYHAFEDALVPVFDLNDRKIGVFLGLGSDDYALIKSRNSNDDDVSPFWSTGTSRSVAAGRLSYTYNFSGPAVVTDTACSSGLSALHLAIRSLRSKEVNLAVCGASNVILSAMMSTAYGRAGFISPDFHCRPFDSHANGYVRSEGCIVFILKRASDALRDGDPIRGVVRGTALDNVGKVNGLTSPSGYAQQRVMRSALRDAQMKVDDVNFVEAHAIGTSVGDAIELEAIAEVFRPAANEHRAPICVGSAKANFGHTESLSGLLGIVKLIALGEANLVISQTSFNEFSDDVKLSCSGRVQLVEDNQPQVENDSSANRLTAMVVNSFGFNGSVASAVVTLHQHRDSRTEFTSDSSDHPIILPLSSNSPERLTEMVDQLSDKLCEKDRNYLADLSCALTTGRSHLKYQANVYLPGPIQSPESYQSFVSFRKDDPSVKTAVLFTGQGSQYAGMGKYLYRDSWRFRQVFDICREGFMDGFGIDINLAMDPAGDDEMLDQTLFAQPSIFSLEVALGTVLLEAGAKPDFMIGHSIGEYAAAVLSGIFTLEDAVTLVGNRAKLMQSLPSGGGMLAVNASLPDIKAILGNFQAPFSIATINGPAAIVLSGIKSDLQNLRKYLKEQGIKCGLLPVSHAFHSFLMEPIILTFRDVAAKISFNRPRIPIICNLDGSFETTVMLSPQYWADHILNTVNFMECVRTAEKEGVSKWLEIGPKDILSKALNDILDPRISLEWSSTTIVHDDDKDFMRLCETCMNIFNSSASINWGVIYPSRRRALSQDKLDVPSAISCRSKF
jgi:acyl transferase domain-containing protein/acyl carrier protein